MSGRIIVALRADERATLCCSVDVTTFQVRGIPTTASYKAGLRGASVAVERTLWQAQQDSIEVEALALALPGGKVWHDWGTALAAQFALPSTSLQLTQAVVRGEQLQGAAIAENVLVFDTDGLRTGLLLNGRPYEGAFGAAGNVAHLGLDRTGDTSCSCGRIGCLAALIDAGSAAPTPPLPAESQPLPSFRHGWLAVAAIALLNIINPKVLILEGAALEGDREFEWLADTIRHGCLAPTRAGLAKVARAQPESALVGATAFAAAHQAGMKCL